MIKNNIMHTTKSYDTKSYFLFARISCIYILWHIEITSVYIVSVSIYFRFFNKQIDMFIHIQITIVYNEINHTYFDSKIINAFASNQHISKSKNK